MKRSRLVATVIAGTAFLASCGIVKIYPTYHYRLTVEVDTPQGLRTGSSVIEVRTSEIKSTLGGAGAEITGEAVAVDLPHGQTLFALLCSERSVDWAVGAMQEVTPVPARGSNTIGEDYARWTAAILANTKLNVVPRNAPMLSSIDTPHSGYAMLVRFADVRDPKSVLKVDPDALDASFGAGVKLRRITVQLTSDPVTKGIETRLGWLVGMRKPLDGRDLMYPDGGLSNKIGSGDFRVGTEQ